MLQVFNRILFDLDFGAIQAHDNYTVVPRVHFREEVAPETTERDTKSANLGYSERVH